jgi:tetratricopeptide (TPR) repeat protein
MAEAQIKLPERFRIEQEIGRGGMAVVYRAHDQHLDRFVAIKVLSEHLSNSLGAERFQREIALMAKLVHPGIVALFDSGEAEGRLYYVMPFVAGENLRTRLTREQRMAVEDAVGFGADVAEALAYAHGAGIVHRDVKPENIFTVGGRAVLADFGIAHIAGEKPSNANLTSAGMVLGTVAYMSPEQGSGEAKLDGRSDLYSLGCVLYELLSGATPFDSSTPVGMLLKHMTEQPRPVRERIEGLPAMLDDIIMGLLAKEPGARPASAADVARALRSVRTSGATVAVPSAPSDANRLAADATRETALSASAGAAARSHLDQAAAYLTRALALEPRNARALCAQGVWYYTMGRHGFLPLEEAHAKGRELVLDALAADDRCAEVHDALGKIAFYYDDDCHSALRHIERAVALDPKDSETRRFQSIVYKVLGRNEDAVRAARAATELTPDLPLSWNALGDALMGSGRNAEAIDALRKAVALKSGYAPALERLEIVHHRLGEPDVALEIRATRHRHAGRPERAEQLLAAATQSSPAEALERDIRAELDEMIQKAGQNDPMDDYYLSRTLSDQIVMTAARLGEWRLAMDWVEKAYARRPARLRRALTDAPFDRRGLAADPRYARLLRVAVLEDLL